MAAITKITETKPLWNLVKKINEPLPVLIRESGQGSISFGHERGGIDLTNGPAKAVESALNVAITKTYTGASTTDYIDVVTDFPWTVSPATSREDVPAVFITEKRIIANSNISNIANSVFASVETIAAGAKAISNTVTPPTNATINSGPVQAAIGKIKNFFNPLITSPLLQNNLGAAPDLASDLISESKTLAESKKSAQAVGNFIENNFDKPSKFNSTLSPYDNLYATEFTGFNYKLPYFGDPYIDASVTYGEGDSGNFLNGIAGLASSVAGALASIQGTFQPGVYIEKSKTFNMSGAGRSISVSFPLLNTRNVSDIPRNWQLIFGLIYQNKPGRYSRSIIDLPVIYEVFIPGVAYMPYACLTRMDVTFKGSRRLMKIHVPASTTNQSIDTIIPDAYEVNMQFTALNEESRNFMYASLGSKVTVN